MLATRGAVYASQSTAGKDNDYHAHCHYDQESEGNFDARTDIRVDPGDAERIVECRHERFGNEYTYDLSRFRNVGVGDIPVPTDVTGGPRAVVTGPGGGGSGGGGFTGGVSGRGEPPIFAQMDRDFAAWSEALTADQRSALIEWQKTDRFYDQVQSALRGSPSNASARRAAATLASAVQGGRLATETSLWRGVRNWHSILSGLHPGATADIQGMFATSVLRSVAHGEFAVGRNPLLLEMRLPPDTRAAWVAGVGNPRLRQQGEVLMLPNATIRIGELRYSESVPVARVEVTWR